MVTTIVSKGGDGGSNGARGGDSKVAVTRKRPGSRAKRLHRNNRIVEEYNAGVPVSDISAKYEISAPRIYQILNEHEEG